MYHRFSYMFAEKMKRTSWKNQQSASSKHRHFSFVFSSTSTRAEIHNIISGNPLLRSQNFLQNSADKKYQIICVVCGVYVLPVFFSHRRVVAGVMMTKTMAIIHISSRTSVKRHPVTILCGMHAHRMYEINNNLYVRGM